MTKKYSYKYSEIDKKKELNIFGFLSLPSRKNVHITSLEITNGVINGRIEKSIDGINEFTISSIAQNFSNYIKNLDKNNSVLITNDGGFNSIFLSKVFASALISENIKAYFLFENQPVNNAQAIYISQRLNEKVNFVVTFSENIKRNDLIISFFDNNGFLLSSKVSNEINSLISQTNLINLTIKKHNVPTLEKVAWEENYVEKIKSDFDLSNLNVSTTNIMKINNKFLEKLFLINNVNYEFLNFKNKRVNENNITRNSILKSLFKSKDLLINSVTNSNEFEFLVKHKRRWKFISLSDLALIYIYYIKNFNNNESKNKHLYLSVLSNKYVNYFAKKNKIKTMDFDELYSLEEKNLDNTILALDGNNYLVTRQNTSFCSDPIMNAKLFLEMVSFFKTKSINLYELLTKIYIENGIFKYNETKEKIDYESAVIYFNKIKKLKTINDKRIIRINQNYDNQINFEIVLEDKTIIETYFIKNIELLVTNISLWNNSNEKSHENAFVDLVVNEQKILAELRSLREKFEIKKFSWAGVIKYTSFVLIFILLCYLMFQFILDSGSNLWHQVKNFLITEKLFSYLIPVFIIAALVQLFLNCFVSIIILRKLNEKAKFKHIFIANFITICISTITPLIYGGESVGYWYLRRKGINKAPVAAMFLIQSLLTQLNFIVFSILFLPLGFVRFYNVILNSNQGSFFLIILVIVGTIIDVFSAVMISMLTFSLKLQNSIAKNLNKFLEWIPFVITREANSSGAKLKYEFTCINEAAKKVFIWDVWYKNTSIFIQLMFLKILAKLFDWGILCAIVGNMINNNDYAFKGFFDMMAGQTLVRSVNAINFIFPGGLGISDWAYKNIMVSMFKYNINKPSLEQNYPDFYNVTVWQTLTRIMFTFTITILSAFTLLTVFIGESRIDKYNKIKNTLTEKEIKDGNVKVKSKFYNFAIIPWFFGISFLIGGWYLFYNFILL